MNEFTYEKLLGLCLAHSKHLICANYIYIVFANDFVSRCSQWVAFEEKDTKLAISVLAWSIFQSIKTRIHMQTIIRQYRESSVEEQ